MNSGGRFGTTDALVSVVIPTFNRAHVIAETLDSVLAQTYPRIEVIVVDDGSSDDTGHALEPYRDRIIYIHQRNQGLAAARNAGLLSSSGRYVAWLDSDDLWNPDKVAMQVRVLEQHADHAMVASDFSAFDEDGFFEESHVRSYYSVLGRTPNGLAGYFDEQSFISVPWLPTMVRIYHGDIYRSLVGGNCLHPPTLMFRRDAASRAGMLDAAFRRDSDWEYQLRLSRQGRTAFIDRPLMRYRYSPDQMSSDKHQADIALSRTLVLDALSRRDPALLNTAAFLRRLGSSHLAVAHALSDGDRAPALGHLIRSLQWGYADANTVRTIAKLCLPRWLIERVRKPKVHENGPPATPSQEDHRRAA